MRLGSNLAGAPTSCASSSSHGLGQSAARWLVAPIAGPRHMKNVVPWVASCSTVTPTDTAASAAVRTTIHRLARSCLAATHAGVLVQSGVGSVSWERSSSGA